MELAAVFVLSIVGGWAFALRWRLTRYATLRADGQHLYFRAALFGVFLFGVALLVRIILITRWPAYKDLDRALAEYFAPILKDPANVRQAELVVTAAMSLALGPLLAELFNLVTPTGWALRKAVSFQDQLLIDAQKQEMPVSITLQNGKVYVGVVRQIPDPARPPAVIALFPMFSGYRDSTGRLLLTTDYEAIYAAVRSNTVKGQFGLPTDWERTFELSIRADQIVTVNMFVPNVYAHFNPSWRNSIGSKAAATPRPELLVEIKRRQPPP